MVELGDVRFGDMLHK